MIGKETQIQYQLKVGDTLTFSKGRPPFNVTYTLTISGFYDLGVASLNRLWGITNFSTVESIFDMGNNVTSLVFQVNDVFAADRIAENFSAILTPENGYQNLVIKNWKAENAQLLSGLNGQTISSIMIQAFVIISVVLGITSVLAITVLQKSKQLGILKAMGVNDGTSAQIFMFQGLLLGIFGAVSGVGLGLGLSYAFTSFAVDSATGQPIIALYIDPNFVILSMLIAIFACIGASLIPAIRSKRLTVIEVIRNG